MVLYGRPDAHWSLFTAAIFFCGGVHVANACPSTACHCDSAASRISCANRHLDSVPSFSAEYGRYQHYGLLDLSQNNIYHIPPRAFQHLRIGAIEIVDNPLVGISPLAFCKQEHSLESLTISASPLSVLHWAVFRHLHRLQSLDLSSNQLVLVKKPLFHDLRNLTTLRISWNRLTQLRAHTFMHQGLLKQLDLQGNRINHIQAGAFAGLNSLDRIVLSRNRLVGLSHEKLHGLPLTLERFEADENDLQWLMSGTFMALTYLNVLSLAGNNMTQISAESLSGLYHLTDLHLQNNAITVFPIEIFGKLPKLSRLHLSGNRIKLINCPEESWLINLSELWLEDNPLECSCGWAWLVEMGKKNLLLSAQCQSPSLLAGRDIWQLNFSACVNYNCFDVDNAQLPTIYTGIKSPQL